MFHAILIGSVIVLLLTDENIVKVGSILDSFIHIFDMIDQYSATAAGIPFFIHICLVLDISIDELIIEDKLPLIHGHSELLFSTNRVKTRFKCCLH